MKNTSIGIAILTALLIVVLLTNWRIRDKYLDLKYDWQNENEAIFSNRQVDEILNNFSQIPYTALSADYLEQTKSKKPKYKKLLSRLTYFKIPRDQLPIKIAGPFRLKDFICKDNYYRDCILNKSDELICIFNPKIFYKTIELIQELERAGYDSNAFDIINGHRHPQYNEQVGGASLSRHIKGEAVDIIIKDINKDGYIDKKDKDIVLDLLEHKIIGNQGGIGLYPGTDNVHYDVRGTRARWNSY